MKITRTFELDDCAAIETSLNNLRIYNRAMYLSLEAKEINANIEIIEQYFQAEEGSEQETALLNTIGASIIRACNDDPAILQQDKVKAGNRMQREFRSALLASKVDYLYETGKFGMPNTLPAIKERELRLKEIALVEKANFIDRASKRLRKIGKGLALGGALTGVLREVIDSDVRVRWTRRAIMWTVSLIPPKVKTAIKEKATELMHKAEGIIDTCTQKFEQTTFGRKVKQVMSEKVAPILKKGINAIGKISEGISTRWRTAKAHFA